MKNAKKKRPNDCNRSSATEEYYHDYYTTAYACCQDVRLIPAALGFALMFCAVGLTDCGTLPLWALAPAGLVGAALMLEGVRHAA